MQGLSACVGFMLRVLSLSNHTRHEARLKNNLGRRTLSSESVCEGQTLVQTLLQAKSWRASERRGILRQSTL